MRVHTKLHTVAILIVVASVAQCIESRPIPIQARGDPYLYFITNKREQAPFPLQAYPEIDVQGTTNVDRPAFGVDAHFDWSSESGSVEVAFSASVFDYGMSFLLRTRTMPSMAFW